MADSLPLAISSRPSLPLPMVAQDLRTLESFIPHALVISFEMIVGNVLSGSDLPPHFRTTSFLTLSS